MPTAHHLEANDGDMIVLFSRASARLPEDSKDSYPQMLSKRIKAEPGLRSNPSLFLRKLLVRSFARMCGEKSANDLIDDIKMVVIQLSQKVLAKKRMQSMPLFSIKSDSSGKTTTFRVDAPHQAEFSCLGYPVPNEFFSNSSKSSFFPYPSAPTTDPAVPTPTNVPGMLLMFLFYCPVFFPYCYLFSAAAPLPTAEEKKNAL